MKKIKILLLIFIIIIILLLIFFLTKINGKQYLNNIQEIENISQINDINKEEIESNTIQIYDIEEGYITVPAITNATKHPYIWSNLKNENNFLKYSDSIYETKLGIDVSSFQGDINWNKVKEEGINFAIIRLGYRGYGTGKIVFDDNFIKNVKAANEVGIETGIYFFSQAINQQEALEEAEFVLHAIKDYAITYPVCYDLEKIKYNETARANNITKEDRTNIAITFCDKIKENGYTPYIYANAKWLTTQLELDKLQEYDIWYADYQYKPIYPYNFSMWQYTESAKIDGITGNVDCNLLFYKK